MTVVFCLIFFLVVSYFFSDVIKKYSDSMYICCSVISLMVAVHAIYILNGYRVEYIPILKHIMKAIDSGAAGGAMFIIVMYTGALDMKFKISKKLKKNRGELSIIACILTIPHNIHYFFNFLISSKTIVVSHGLSLWTNLMMFTAGVFAIGIMIPLFVTSFIKIRKKMNSKKWKNLQEYAYIFYAMVYIQVMMVYISRPSGWSRNFNLLVYTLIFFSYTVLRIQKMYKKNILLRPKAVNR